MQHGLKLAIVAIVVALGMIASAFLLSKLFVRIGREEVISVKGYAETNVMSDMGSFTCTWQARGTNLAEAYDSAHANGAEVMAYLKQQGFADDELKMENLSTIKVYQRDSQGRQMNAVEFYDAVQSVKVNSPNVALIRDTAVGITELIKEDIDLRVSSPDFIVSDLSAPKMALLAMATEDGYLRAIVLAQNSKGTVGALIGAEQGVFQITRPHSTETSGYGMYDTATIEKSAKAVVTLRYAIVGGK